MQTIIGKLFVSLSLIFWFAMYSAHSQPSEKLLSQGDSLFELKKYTESYALYDSLLQKGDCTPRMLLKMAFIQEGSHKPEKALYLLNLYQKIAPDPAVNRKIADLAEKNALKGHEMNDKVYFTALFKQYKVWLYALLSMGALASAIGLSVAKEHVKARKAAFAALPLSLVLLVLLNGLERPAPQAILAKDETLLMEGPSAGADALIVEKAGHKLPVSGENDVWWEVEWEGRKMFVKKSSAFLLK